MPEEQKYCSIGLSMFQKLRKYRGHASEVKKMNTSPTFQNITQAT